MTESADPDFDAVILWARIAGSVTAALLARDGHSVALIERGEAPGSKNLSGEVLCGHVLDSILPTGRPKRRWREWSRATCSHS